MTIGICDDDENAIIEIEHICRECMDSENDFVKFKNGRDLFECSEEIDLLILDIEMPDMNGIEVKNRFLRWDKKTIIIFVTDHHEFVEEAFGINVMGFVRKSRMKQQLPVMLETADNMLNRYQMITDQISSLDVLYIRSAHNYCELVLCDGDITLIRKTMQEIEKELLEYDFVRIHRKYLINLKWVKKLGEKTEFVQIDGAGDEILPIVSRLRADVRERYNNFRRRNARYC